MSFLRRIVLAAGIALAPAAPAAAGSSAPAIKLRDAKFGAILATPQHRALYAWNVEKQDFKVHCTDSCAEAWPPLIVRSAALVPARLAGVKGTFGTIRRPDGKLQVTYNRRPVYTYAHEGQNQVLCDNVGGWFVVRV